MSQNNVHPIYSERDKGERVSVLLKNKTVYGSILLVALSGCSPEKTTGQHSGTATPVAQAALPDNALSTVEITNSHHFALQQEPVYFSFNDLGVNASDEAVRHLSVTANGATLPTQTVDSDGDGILDSLLLVSDFAPDETRSFSISRDPAIQKAVLKKQTQAEISIKEGGEWKGAEYVGGTFKNVAKVTPPPQYTERSAWIRYEGPGIESDKVAYRVYLDARNGFDIFGKRVREMVLQNLGHNDGSSYHDVNAAWGVDVLSVGKSLGMGGYGFWNGKGVEQVAVVDAREAMITDNGDLYSGFKITYHGWQINNQKLDLVAHLSMTAGSRLVKVKLNAGQPLPNFAIGLVKHPGTTFMEGPQNTDGYTYAASWGKQSLSGENDYLGMAVIFRRAEREQQTQDENSYVSVMKDQGGELEYYFLAAWEHELNGIKTEAEFKAYLDNEVQRLSKTPSVQWRAGTSNKSK